jgi:hypothetical protein
MPAFFARVLAAGLAPLAAAQSPLTTTFTSNNLGSVGGAIYFDLVATTPLTVLGLDLNFASTAGTVGTVEVYTCSGTRAGNQTNPGAWTLATSGAVTAAGSGVPTPVAITPFVLAGSVGIALKAIGLAHAYTNGTGANQNFNTAELAIHCGEATNVPFTGGLFTPRVVNCNISYGIGTGSVATAAAYGTGCVTSFASFYEDFPPATFDLSNSFLMLVPGNGGYLVLWLPLQPGTFVPPSALATSLSLGFNSETTVPLTAPFPFPGGSTGSLTICSQGFVSVATGNGAGALPVASTMLSAPQTAWWTWHDFNPSATGPNTVWLERIGTNTVITWNAVPDVFGGTSASTWQMQFDSASGIVQFVYLTMSTGGNRYVVGFSPGGPSLDPGNRDISATPVGAIATSATDVLPLRLRATSRPIIGTTCNMLTDQIPPGTPFGGAQFGLVRFDPGIDLSSIGMPGCFRYTDGAAALLFVTGGATQPLALTIPAGLPVGLQAFVQTATYSPPLTPLGFIASNGLALTVGSL